MLFSNISEKNIFRGKTATIVSKALKAIKIQAAILVRGAPNKKGHATTGTKDKEVN